MNTPETGPTYREMALRGYNSQMARAARPDTAPKTVSEGMRVARAALRAEGYLIIDIGGVPPIPPPAEEAPTASRPAARAPFDPARERAYDQLRSGFGCRLPAHSVSAASRTGLTGAPEKRGRR